MRFPKTHFLLLLAFVFTLSAATFKTNTASNTSIDIDFATSADNIRGVTYQSFTRLTKDLDSLPSALNKAWKLWKAEKWDKLETYFEKNNFNGEYPPAQGFISVDTVVLADDTRVDRYGSLYGAFVAPTGTPFGERALPASSKSRTYYRFEVIKDIPGVLKGKAIPWFSEPGKGTQYLMPKSIMNLIQEGYIIVLDSIVPKGKLDKYH